MTYKTMTYCPDCGTALEKRFLENEGDIPYCSNCQAFRFPIFNTACSMIVLNDTKDKILLVKQYGGKDFILTAGYVNQGEAAEETVRREIKEELNLDVLELTFNQSAYYEKTNTLMLNFIVTTSGHFQPNHEIDSWQWFEPHQAKAAIKPNSLAENFLHHYLDKLK